MRIPFLNIEIGRAAPTAVQVENDNAVQSMIIHDGRRLSVSDDDPYGAGSGLSGAGSAIHTLVSRLSTDDLDIRTALELRHIIRTKISDVQTAIIYRRALEGELLIESDDAGLLDEVLAFCKTIPVGYIGGTASARGLETYLDMLANGADEYGLAIGEKIFDGQRLDRLVAPDMRTMSIERDSASGLYRLVQNQGGRLVPIDGGTVHSLTFRTDGSRKWPPAMIDGAELIAEALLRMLTSLNTIWLKAGDPPMIYSISYDKDAAVPTTSITQPDGTTVQADANLSSLASAIRQVKDARRRGMMAEIVFSVVGGKLEVNSVFGNPTTEGLVEQAEPHFRIASSLISQMSEVPSWIFAAGSGKSEGIGSNRSNQEAAIAFAAAERRRRKIAPIARDIINTFILGQRAPGSVDNFRIGWTPPSIIDEEIVQRARKDRAAADQTFVRTSFELFNPDGAEIVEAQREYLEKRGVLAPTRDEN